MHMHSNTEQGKQQQNVLGDGAPPSPGENL